MGGDVQLDKTNVLANPPADKWFVPYLPISGDQTLEIFIDGEDYAKSLHQAIKGAAEEICLTGLHFTGHFHLTRSAGCDPLKGDDPEALQDLLAKASQKAQIYLVVNQFWTNESSLGFDYWQAYRDLDKHLWKTPHPIRGTIIASGGIADYLEKTFAFFSYLETKGNKANIHCYTDIHQGYVFHSNHQKTIIVDRKIAFLGGIDLTDIDGDRWDNKAHATGNALRAFDKPERNWHDIAMRVDRADMGKACAVDYVYANFLGRYNHGYLYTPHRPKPNGPLASKKAKDAPKLEPDSKGLTDHGKSARDYVPSKFWYYPDQRERLVDDLQKFDYPLVQVVRSMPEGNWDNYEDKQHPLWSRAKQMGVTTEYEHSARDAYLKGIAAAEKFIYLENQWIADERIWEALVKAAEKNAEKADFRLVVVLPKKFLAAAGYGRDQDINLYPHVRKVAKIFKDKGNPKNFGVYSILQPAAQKGGPGHPADHTHWEVPECVWDYVYVHSKVMVVDDVWVLIGSANAGGISLTGLGFKSEPDTELSTITLDLRDPGVSVVKAFRKRVWAEHLGVSEGDIDDYKAGADRFHQQAEGQYYNSTNAPRVHYNLLYYPNSLKAQDGNKRNKGIWKHLKWEAIEHQSKFRVNNRHTLHQSYYNLSGPLTAVHMMIERDPGRYLKLVDNIYHSGRDPDCQIKIRQEDVFKSEWFSELAEMAIEPEHPILEVDWMVASAVTDSTNWVLDYQGSVSETVATVCSDGDMLKHMERLVGCKGGVEHFSCEATGEMKAARKVSAQLAAAPTEQVQGKTVPTVFVAVKISPDLLIQFDEDAFKRDKKAIDDIANEADREAAKLKLDKGDPKYWTSRIHDNRFLCDPGDQQHRLRRDRAYPLYPGVLTPYDVKHILGDRMFVRLLAPLEFILQGDEVKEVKMTFWTWGAQSTIQVPAKVFVKQVYGFFVGYYTNRARSQVERKDLTQAVNQDLSAGMQRDYQHDDVDKADVTVECHSGSIDVELSRRVWSSWEVTHRETLNAGGKMKQHIGEASKVCDQDCRVVVKAKMASKYSLTLASYD